MDVRAVTSSRKPGFSRRQLEAAALEAGLHYTHLRALGTPKPGRDAARRGDAATMHRIFDAHMQAPEPQADLARAAAISREAPTCLLCFERDHLMCHRDILAGLICAGSGARVTHLLARRRKARAEPWPSFLHPIPVSISMKQSRAHGPDGKM